ncbi:MAG TPA: GtrA family protein [Acidimicrobiales bacterium]|nr:GtrA family protein [Acidimicrobiales bacterium]
MDLTPSGLMARARTPGGKKLIRYTMVSGVSVIVFEVLLFVTFGLLHWTVTWANVFAVSVSAIPSYYLNRKWAWGKHGRSHFMKEVVPFWGMALLGLVFSTITADLAKDWADEITENHLLRTFIVMMGTLAAFGVLWVGKFFVLNKVLFVHSEHEQPKVST